LMTFSTPITSNINRLLANPNPVQSSEYQRISCDEYY
jgi:hypothetical protein